jgi:hypothetical protein
MEIDQMIAEARMLSGEGQGRKQLPTIKFMSRDSKNGTMGHFYLLRKDEKTGELTSDDLGTTIDITILKFRKMLDNKKDGMERVYSYEFDSTEPGAMIGVKEGNKEVELMTYKEAKEKYPSVKYFEVFYVAYKDELCKMKISGSSLGGWFKYQQDFPINDTIMRYFTTLNSIKNKHSEGDYQSLTFTKGQENPNFGTYLETVRTLRSGPTASASLPEGQVVEGPEEEKINVEEIPF